MFLESPIAWTHKGRTKVPTILGCLYWFYQDGKLWTYCEKPVILDKRSPRQKYGQIKLYWFQVRLVKHSEVPAACPSTSVRVPGLQETADLWALDPPFIGDTGYHCWQCCHSNHDVSSCTLRNTSLHVKTSPGQPPPQANVPPCMLYAPRLTSACDVICRTWHRRNIPEFVYLIT